MLPNYDEFLAIKKARLMQEDKSYIRINEQYANDTYWKIEANLLRGYLNIGYLSDHPSRPDDYKYEWRKLLKDRCLKEGWLISGENNWMPYIKMRHVSQLNWLEKKLHGV